ncbi:regulator of Ty1 transposition protein 10 [Apiospora kogelbergensis]|uniref:Ribosome biogenesis regulatory protein n=1 Tax=Apiospora kogelbergensis TaxID=1337665 RepID=A0AAW0QVZ8_9PEZI
MASTKPKLDISVDKPTPYTFDLGLLLANDANPLPPSTSSGDLEERLAATARDGAQALINQMLTTLPLSSTPAGVLLTLPQTTTPLPREKPLPAQKEKTKWQQFAERKGIKPKTREQRREKSRTFNEDKGEWEKTWGYKGKRKEGVVPDDWVVEVNEKTEREAEEKKKQKKKQRKA